MADFLALQDRFCNRWVLAHRDILILLWLLMSNVLDRLLVVLQLFLQSLNQQVSLLKFRWGVYLLELVDVYGGLNMFRLLTEMQRVYCLLIVRQRLGYRADNCCLWVAAKRILKYSGHLRISIVDELLTPFALAKLVNDIGKCKQTAIDIWTLTQTKPICLCLADTFATCQVHKVKLGNLGSRLVSESGLTLQVKPKHSVRSAWDLVQFCFSDVSDFIALHHVV